jgi:light-regulated signal transduction histidine kinase (bacteriophytochrome)
MSYILVDEVQLPRINGEFVNDPSSGKKRRSSVPVTREYFDKINHNSKVHGLMLVEISEESTKDYNEKLEAKIAKKKAEKKVKNIDILDALSDVISSKNKEDVAEDKPKRGRKKASEGSDQGGGDA